MNSLLSLIPSLSTALNDGDYAMLFQNRLQCRHYHRKRQSYAQLIASRTDPHSIEQR